MKEFKRKQYRQGDVLLVEMSPDEWKKANKGTLKVKHAGDKGVILALGEATGHHHSAYGSVAFFRPDDLPSGSPGGFLHVEGDDVVLRHQEHDEQALAPGYYRQVIQVEDSGENARRVWD